MRRSAACLLALAASACGPQRADPLGQLQQALSFPQGVNRAAAFSVSEAQTYASTDGISWSGASIGGPCNAGTGWSPQVLTALNQAVGWRFLPLYTGQQFSCAAKTLTAPQGTLDGRAAAALMATYSWPPDAGIPVCLELLTGNYANNPLGTVAYVDAWATEVRDAGYRGYLRSDAQTLSHFSGLAFDGVWIAESIFNGYQPGLSPYTETTLTTYRSHDRAWEYASSPVGFSTADLPLAPAPGQANTAATLSQLSANDAFTALTEANGGAEVFFATPSGQLMRAESLADAGIWSAASAVATGVTCGNASLLWPAPYNVAQLFSPLADGGTAQTPQVGAGFGAPQSLGGGALSHLEAVALPDGQVGVFALHSDGTVWYQFSNSATWSGWQPLGGTAQSGPAPILFPDGHAEVFVTAPGGGVSHLASSGPGWSAWTPLAGTLASRPIPVRRQDGTVALYGIGLDGSLYQALNTAGTWSALTAVATATPLSGQPSVVARPDGTVDAFSRDAFGNVVFANSGPPWGQFQPLGGTQSAASDPFAWARTDGSQDVFIVDGSGELLSIHRTAAGGWGSWTPVASGVDPCSTASPIPDGGMGTPDAGTPPIDGGVPSADAGAGGNLPGKGCHCGGGGLAPVGLLAAVVLLAARRRRA